MGGQETDRQKSNSARAIFECAVYASTLQPISDLDSAFDVSGPYPRAQSERISSNGPLSEECQEFPRIISFALAMQPATQGKRQKVMHGHS